jgi:dihydroxyacetone kinase-like protein
MGKGSAAIANTLPEYHAEAIGPLLAQCGMAFNRAAPSTMGTLTSMALISLGHAWKEKTTLTEQDVVKAPRILADTIAKFGKAKQGNKTILDALYPFAETLETVYRETNDFAKAYDAAACAAQTGMEATKGMIATVGRARWIGARTQNVLDGGALLCVYLIEGLHP